MVLDSDNGLDCQRVLHKNPSLFRLTFPDFFLLYALVRFLDHFSKP